MLEIKVLRVKICLISKNNALKECEQFLCSSVQHIIFTPNPEFLVKAYHDYYFTEVLNKSDLNLCDGKGIQLVSTKKIERIPGVDFMLELCALAEKEQKSVYILGALFTPQGIQSEEIATKTQNILKQKFPKLKIAGWNKGPKISESEKGYKLRIEPEENEEVIKDIQDKKPDILFVAFGMGKQEKWIYEYLKRFPSVKIAMGVGGAFDFISGIVPRAPLWMRKLGLEWLFRLFKQPQRIRRIWNATIVFPWLTIKESLKKKKNTVE